MYCCIVQIGLGFHWVSISAIGLPMIAASVIEFNQFFPINFTIFSFLCLCLSMHYVRKVHLVIIGPEAAEK